MRNLCKVDGCSKPHDSHGFCGAHAARWKRHGDPLAGRTSPGVAERYLTEIVLQYEGDECLRWPFGQNGDGRGIFWTGSAQLVHRIVCEKAYGLAPSPFHQAAHSCGNGHLACVTKRHLRWATAAENEADKVMHGTSNRGGDRSGSAKLNAGDVREILNLKGQLTQQEIADRYGVQRTTVSSILNGHNWLHIAEETQCQA